MGGNGMVGSGMVGSGMGGNGMGGNGNYHQRGVSPNSRYRLERYRESQPSTQTKMMENMGGLPSAVPSASSTMLDSRVWLGICSFMPEITGMGMGTGRDMGTGLMGPVVWVV